MFSIDLAAPIVPTREQIDSLQESMTAGVLSGEFPLPEMRTDHYVHNGMYCRKVWRAAGTLIVGKVHKFAHFFVCISGEVVAWSETGMRVLQPGDVIESWPGTKRVTLALKDSICLTMHTTDKTDIEEIENELVEDDPTALFENGNQIKKWAYDLLALKSHKEASP